MEIDSKATRTSFTTSNDVKVDKDDVIVTYDCDITAVTRTKKKYKWYHVNLKMVPSKMAYFFEMARRLGFAPNLILFLTSIGLNKAESGFIVGLRSVAICT